MGKERKLAVMGKEKKRTSETHQQCRSHDADTPVLNTLSLVALTLEPCPTPIKHLKAFTFPLPQINNIQPPHDHDWSKYLI